MQLVKNPLLPFTVFVTGACVLIIEIVATRILAPYFGNTLYSVSSVISVVLAALSVGYWFGGKLADRYPSKKLFFGIITLSGLLVLFMQFMQTALLGQFGYTLPLASGPLIMSMLLFFMPSFVLGTLSPFAVALQQRIFKKQGVGTTAGQIFFFSTVGSIVGSLLAGFVLLPQFGVSAIVVGVGNVLFLLGVIPLIALGIQHKDAIVVVLLAGSILLLTASASFAGRYSHLVYEQDGLYEKIVVFDGMYKGRPTRFLQQDTSNSAARYLDGDDLAYDYTRYYALHQVFAPQVDRALVIGGGAYSIPKALLTDLPKAKIDVSEIEPALIGVSKKYFGLQDDPRLTHYIKDGRRMLHDTPSRHYDLILSDVYHSMYSVPSHFTTREFMQLAAERLTDKGVFIANLIGSTQADGPSFIWSEIKTMQQVFPQVYMFAVQSPVESGAQNIIAVGSMRHERLDMFDGRWRANPNPLVAEIASHYVDTKAKRLDAYTVLTDDYAPVDYLAAKVLPKR